MVIKNLFSEMKLVAVRVAIIRVVVVVVGGGGGD
jgi:hypothetical protein